MFFEDKLYFTRGVPKANCLQGPDPCPWQRFCQASCQTLRPGGNQARSKGAHSSRHC